jgi:hypothetical protein
MTHLEDPVRQLSLAYSILLSFVKEKLKRIESVQQAEAMQESPQHFVRKTREKPISMAGNVMYRLD